MPYDPENFATTGIPVKIDVFAMSVIEEVPEALLPRRQFSDDDDAHVASEVMTPGSSVTVVARHRRICRAQICRWQRHVLALVTKRNILFLVERSRNLTLVVRRIVETDLVRIQPFGFTVSIEQPLTDADVLEQQFVATGFWQENAGALAVDVDGEMVGTCQFYRSAPCIHGYEIGYIIHDPSNRGKGYAKEALRLFTNLLLAERVNCYRLQLIIEVWNVASWKVAERCGYVREGLLRSAGFGTGDPSDCFIYSRSRKDWHEQQNASVSLGGVP